MRLLAALLLGCCLVVSSASSATAVTGPTYVVGTWTGDTIRLFIDGRQVARRSASVTAGTPAQGEIGTFLGGDVWDGTIDDVALYRQALPAAVIERHFAAGTTGPPGRYAALVLANPALVSFWPLQGATPATANVEAEDAAKRNPGVYRKGRYGSAPSLVAGERNGALSLNGQNGGVLIPKVTGVDPRAGFALEAWVRARAKRDATIFTTIGSAFLKTDAAGHFGFGGSAGAQLVSVFSRQTVIPTVSRRAGASGADNGSGRRGASSGGSAGGLWVIPVVLLVVVALAFAARELVPKPTEDRAVGKDSA
ncbi:MAG TPA: LamG-like jellyroll fold domain-containing protein [Solirubrobacteraceae bacterium]|nr:LamG-like jellyroll fold domain-containing protein [Solirubrobacteraceae bacterium]